MRLHPLLRRRLRRAVRVLLITLSLGLVGVMVGVSMGVLIADHLDKLPEITFLPTAGPTEQGLTATANFVSIKATLQQAITQKALSRTPSMGASPRRAP